ncbi:DNA-directed RNA polymerase subunit alpha C-terminal domain-containing protein [Caloramator proteoclasticus]|uniref:RNA polymerase, alpha chain C terminal domain n=1 Tax=Caloramator proteoclasticus DSM 10124 TaxID=1121262 RepID=A0A1M4T4F9_9CLOT|nr:DNA-directed RNA polymerase subunit alpha C-terminal domain-containing protein [Caloramator proteoclasticus]SHE39248.1 RNA polymerase, alpha chain C terminal domain [Caloramator proteoclasticus DSM 10124]
MKFDNSIGNFNSSIIDNEKNNNQNIIREKLEKRILKEFKIKKLIGDIIINDSEYEILIEDFRNKCKIIENSASHSIIDPLFATALVYIGIKYYDGSFWPHVAKILSVDKLTINFQGWIGDSFINTLKRYNKVIIDENEKVKNILMHGFVSDYYANDMFNFLFKYYDIDLERDLSRNNKEMMNNLIEIIQRNDNTGRTYLLVKQTANAIIANKRGGKIRIRRLLKLIDKCFYDQVTPINPVSRMSILFNKWQENSEDFKIKRNQYNLSFSKKKSFSSPYLKCDLKNTKFKLILPSQLIKFENEGEIKWKINTSNKNIIVDTYTYEAVTGNKTQEMFIDINPLEIFDEFIVELLNDEKSIRCFKLKSHCIRFFDKDGNLLNTNSNLPKGEDVYSFTKKDEIPISEAILDNEIIGNLLRTCFNFSLGDYVRLPDGKVISIDKKIEEGLLYRNSLKDCYAEYNNEILPIYKSPPVILIKIQENRAKGTIININGKNNRMFDEIAIKVDLNDGSNEVGYIINLKDYGCIKDGVYEVFIDVPNDRTNRYWRFALINGIEYSFEDAPYIFKTKATIVFNENLKIISNDITTEKNRDDNSFNFEINSNKDYIDFLYEFNNENIKLFFKVPVLKWSLDNNIWNIEKMLDIWHSEFPSKIYIKGPFDKMKFSLDENIGNEEKVVEQAKSYLKSKDGVFVCDISVFKSWFGREKIKRSIFIEFDGYRIEFLNVITKSVVADHILKGNFTENELIGNFKIIGNANYYVDIVYTKTSEPIASKLPIINGTFSIKQKLLSGKYELTIYEDEEDDTGFGISNYLYVDRFYEEIINPYDLSGKSLEIKGIKKGENSLFEINLSCRYVINDLKKIDDNNYAGVLLVDFQNKSPINYNVKVNFYDLNKIKFVYLTFYDGYEYVEFLLDNFKNIIVKEEEKGLKGSVKYRRYTSLYPEDYVFIVDFTDSIPMLKEDIVNFSKYNSFKNDDIDLIPIEKLGLSTNTYNILKSAHIKTANTIEKMTYNDLLMIKNLDKNAILEIITAMRRIGIKVDHLKYNKQNK